MHINSLPELCLVNDPWKADNKHNEDLTRLFVLDSNFSQGICSTYLHSILDGHVVTLKYSFLH